MMNFWNSAAGIVEVELTSAEPAAALTAISEKQIPIIDVRSVSDLTVRFTLRRSHYRSLREIAQGRGDTLRVIRRTGLYWKLKGLIRRPVLITGLFLIFLLLTILPTRVLFIRVEGNSHVPAAKIIAAAEDSGIRFWASRREVRSERVKNALLGALPELQWAGVNTKGCVAYISVRERAVSEDTSEPQNVCSIVAARDGVVDSCTATRGNLLCAPGQAVVRGQTLISAYTDCGLYLRADRAEGEVYALTRREIEVVTPATALSRTETGKICRRYSLILGKKRINFWKGSGICPSTCGRMYEEYYITLPGGFRLPIALAVDTCYPAEILDAQLPEPDLSTYARSYLLQQMVAGQILSGEETCMLDSDIYRYTASFVCREMIGRVRWEEIGELYVENS